MNAVADWWCNADFDSERRRWGKSKMNAVVWCGESLLADDKQKIRVLRMGEGEGKGKIRVLRNVVGFFS